MENFRYANATFETEVGLIQKSEQRDGTEFDGISSHSKKIRSVTSFMSLYMCQLRIIEEYNNSYGTDNESVSMATTSFYSATGRNDRLVKFCSTSLRCNSIEVKNQD